MQLEANVVIAERFRLNRQLGRGGMGSVWHATHLGLDIPCALKFIESGSAQLAEAQARFEREAKAAAHLRSPHVVQILDHGVWQGTPYIAMELLDGEDLGKRLLRVGRLPPVDVVRIVTQVCRALTKAHAVGIVHRDLKPDNVFLVKDDDRELTKVVDFGIAKATGKAVDASQTRTGALLGTPYYMSPEQAQGTKAVDHRSDLWSLAVIAFQALTGRLPFESEALGDLLVKIIVTPVPVPSHVVSDLPVDFDHWWAKASQRDPSLRFQTAKEFAEALGYVFGQPGSADLYDRMPSRNPDGSPGPSFPPNNRMRSSSNPPPPLVAGSVPPPGTLALAAPDGARSVYPSGMPVIPTTGAPMSRTFGGTPNANKKRPGPVLAIGGAAVVAAVLGIAAFSYMRGKEGAHPPAAATTAEAPVLQQAAVAPASAAAAPSASEVLAPPPVEAASAAPSEAPSSAKPHEAEAALVAKTAHPPAVAPPQHAPKPPAAPSGKPPKFDLGI